MQPREFRVLASLAQHVGQVLSRDVLLELAYPDPGAVTDRVIDVQILGLRPERGASFSIPARPETA